MSFILKSVCELWLYGICVAVVIFDETVFVRRSGASHDSWSESEFDASALYDPSIGSHMYIVSKYGISAKRNGILRTDGRIGPKRAGFVSCGSILSRRMHSLVFCNAVTVPWLKMCTFFGRGNKNRTEINHWKCVDDVWIEYYERKKNCFTNLLGHVNEIMVSCSAIV